MSTSTIINICVCIITALLSIVVGGLKDNIKDLKNEIKELKKEIKDLTTKELCNMHHDGHKKEHAMHNEGHKKEHMRIERDINGIGLKVNTLNFSKEKDLDKDE